MLRLVIADDHALIREGLHKVFAHEADIEVVGEAGSHAMLLELLAASRPDVVLMDPGMPGDGSLETLREIARRHPKLPVLILSMLPEDQAAMHFIRAGAAGFVSKEAPPQDLVGAVRMVARGKRYFSEALQAHISGNQRVLHEKLSPREMEVLLQIAKGRAVKEIADRLGIAVSTIHTHRVRILEKLACRSDVELARYAVRYHLAD